jgi:2,3-bisphosphoglycerate-dependent phosphoglycerate mutase
MVNSMQLYFIRHAQSTNNELWARTTSSKGRVEDPPLTAIGRQQAALLAQYLAQPHLISEDLTADFQNHTGFGITHLYCSLMMRALETGTAVAQALNLPLVARDDIHELGGIWLEDEESGGRMGLPGNRRSQLLNQFPHITLPDTIDEEGWWRRPHEEADEALGRAQSAYEALLARHGDTEDRVAIISHGGFFQRFTAVALDLPPSRTVSGQPGRRRFGINNVAITRFSFNGEDVDLVYLNRADFLPPELVTY